MAPLLIEPLYLLHFPALPPDRPQIGYDDITARFHDIITLVFLNASPRPVDRPSRDLSASAAVTHQLRLAVRVGMSMCLAISLVHWPPITDFTFCHNLPDRWREAAVSLADDDKTSCRIEPP
jgi:hypothetical protein